MIWTFLLKNWKFAVMGLLVIGLLSLYGILSLKITYLKAEVKNLKADIRLCTDANTSNAETIKSLQAEIKAGNKICNSRLNSKDRLIEKLRKIDNLEGGNIEGSSGDSVLDSLNRMFRDN